MESNSGYLRKLSHTGIGPVSYFWNRGVPKTLGTKATIEETISPWPLESLLGKRVRLTTNGEIRCLECGKKTKKSFNQGYCFVCFSTKAKNDLCILRPETCHHHKGTCREPEWGTKYCFQTHTVYFANASGLKVGITRDKPYTNRWVDQGASYAIPILETKSRRESGILESYLAKFLSDKTSWQKMVSSDPEPVDLRKEANKFLTHLQKVDWKQISPDLEPTWKPLPLNEVFAIQYPILSYPNKVKSLKLTPESPIEDVLVGIKGQYLLFQSGVINIRSLGGLWVELQF